MLVRHIVICNREITRLWKPPLCYALTAAWSENGYFLSKTAKSAFGIELFALEGAILPLEIAIHKSKITISQDEIAIAKHGIVIPKAGTAIPRQKIAIASLGITTPKDEIAVAKPEIAIPKRGISILKTVRGLLGIHPDLAEPRTSLNSSSGLRSAHSSAAKHPRLPPAAYQQHRMTRDETTWTMITQTKPTGRGTDGAMHKTSPEGQKSRVLKSVPPASAGGSHTQRGNRPMDPPADAGGTDLIIYG